MKSTPRKHDCRAEARYIQLVRGVASLRGPDLGIAERPYMINITVGASKIMVPYLRYVDIVL